MDIRLERVDNAPWSPLSTFAGDLGEHPMYITCHNHSRATCAYGTAQVQ